MTSKKNTIIVSPISGGYFPHQLSALMWISDAHQKPELVLASSGGNVASYFVQGAQWSSDKITEYASAFSSKSLVDSWFPDYLSFIPSGVAGIMHGSLYRIGRNFQPFFDAVYRDKAKLTSTEIWTGTVNFSRNCIELFCNKQAKNSFLDPGSLVFSEYNKARITYVGQNAKLLADICFASAAVPTIFPQVVINKEFYVDGGTGVSSPLTPLYSTLENKYKNDLHIIYLSSQNLVSNPDEIQGPVCDINSAACADTLYQQSSIVTTGTQSLKFMINNLSNQDKENGIKLAMSGVDPAKVVYVKKTYNKEEFIDLVSVDRYKYRRSFIEVYPLGGESIDFTNFKGEEIFNILSINHQRGFGVRYWHSTT